VLALPWDLELAASLLNCPNPPALLQDEIKAKSTTDKHLLQ
jgi:hypothetical protein